MQHRIFARAALAAASLVLAAPSFAQQPYTPPGAAPRSYTPPGPPSPAMIDQRLAALHGRLGLNASQEAAWRAFFDAMHQQAQQMQSAGSRMPAPTAPERFAEMSQVMQQSAASMGVVAQALGALYAQLSPQQRSVVEGEFQAPAAGSGTPLR